MDKCQGCGYVRTTCQDCMFLLCGHAWCPVFQDTTFLFGRSHRQCGKCGTLRCNGQEKDNESEGCRCELPYYLVTPELAIGHVSSPRDSFDLIVDLSHPSNGCTVGEIRESPTTLSIGLPEGDTEEVRSCYAKAVTAVCDFLKRVKQPHHRVLFLSTRGQTRSVLVCMYYLFRVVHRCSPLQVYTLIRAQATRPVIIPRGLGDMFGMCG